MLKVSEVSKSYGRILAVENLNFSVERNEVLGLLGANGAGKSTIMNMLSAYFFPVSGRIVLDQADSRKNNLEFSSKIGYLPEIPPLYPDMKVCEQLRLVGRIKGVPKSRLEDELRRVAGCAGVIDVFERRNRTLSKGYKQRVGLAQALIGSPQLLILDEPTAGLDPRQIIEFRNLVEVLKKDMSIIISSHILSEIAAVADRVVVLNAGRVVADSRVSELASSSVGETVWEARIEGNPDLIEPIIAGIPSVAAVSSGESSEQGCFDYRIHPVPGEDIRRELFTRLSALGHPLLGLKSLTPTLEESFLALTQPDK